MHKRDGEPSEVANIIIEQLSGVVHLIIEAAVADLLYIGVVRSRDELLEVGEAARPGVRVDEFRFDVGFARLLAGHLGGSSREF